MNAPVTLYREIDALGGTGGGDYHQGHSDALTQVLGILTRRGFSEHEDASPVTGMSVADVRSAIERLTELAKLESEPPAITKAMIWSYLHGQSDGRSGMPLRDWYAAHAPITLGEAGLACSFSVLSPSKMAQPSYRVGLWAAMAVLRYEYADAMLAERAK